MRPPQRTLTLFLVLLGLLANVAFSKTTYTSRSFVGNTGILSSPNFPDLYPNERSDTIVIDLGVAYRDGYNIHIDFLIFQLENLYDTVQIFDGNTTDPSANIALLTGNMTSRGYLADGPVLTLVFVTDITGQRDGFFAKWNAVKKGESYTPSSDCTGLVIQGDNSGYGVIRSPGYLGNYPDSINCTYYLQAATDQKVLLKFFSYETEECYDLLSFYDGSLAIDKFKRPKSMCGDLVNPTTMTELVLSNGPKFTLQFSSDLTRNYQGFVAVYRYVSASESVASDYMRMDLSPSNAHPKNIKQLPA